MKKCQREGCDKEIADHRKYCSFVCNNIVINSKMGKEIALKIANTLSGPKKEYEKNPKKCKTCDVVLSYEKRNNLFCNRSCSAKTNNLGRSIDYTLSKEGLEKIRLSSKKTTDEKYGEIKEFIVNCKSCGNEIKVEEREKLHPKKEKYFCSKKCIGIHIGRISASKKVRRSKGEVYFYELCKKEFSRILHNEPIFEGWDADIILPNEKIAVLYNGKWHYEKVMEGHSVSQVQNRDRIKIEKIKKSGYLSYIIKDTGRFSREFVEKEFEKFLNFVKNKIKGSSLA